jgi:hypothetical protein
MRRRVFLLILGLLFFQAAGLAQENFIQQRSVQDVPAKEEGLAPGMVSRERADEVILDAGEDANYFEEWSAVTKVQPIAEGDKIYSITSLEKKSTEIERGRFRRERIWKTKKYVYDAYLYGSIKVVYMATDQYDIQDSMVRYDAASEPKGRSEVKKDTQEIILPLDNRRQATLETVDGKRLIITVLERSTRITVEEE